MFITDKEQLKDIVANMDADIYIKRKDAVEISAWLISDGYSLNYDMLQEVIEELNDDPFFKRMVLA